MRLVYYSSARTQTYYVLSVDFISGSEVIFVVVPSDFYVSALKGTKDFSYDENIVEMTEHCEQRIFI